MEDLITKATIYCHVCSSSLEIILEKAAGAWTQTQSRKPGLVPARRIYPPFIRQGSLVTSHTSETRPTTSPTQPRPQGFSQPIREYQAASRTTPGQSATTLSLFSFFFFFLKSLLMSSCDSPGRLRCPNPVLEDCGPVGFSVLPGRNLSSSDMWPRWKHCRPGYDTKDDRIMVFKDCDYQGISRSVNDLDSLGCHH